MSDNDTIARIADAAERATSACVDADADRHERLAVARTALRLLAAELRAWRLWAEPVALAPVPRGHCGRCDRCGRVTEHTDTGACLTIGCTRDATPRTHCAGCGAPYEETPPASRPRPICDTPGCGREIPVGGEGHPEICPKCLAAPVDGGEPAPLAPVPRGHCWACDRCGSPHGDVGNGCLVGDCSRRPLPPPRSHCAGCGAPYEVEAPLRPAMRKAKP